MLEEKLNEDLKTSLKSKDPVRVSVIRMLKADINMTAIRAGSDKLTDEEIMKVIQRQIKQRGESIQQFRAGNREDLAGKEQSELEVLKSYLPEQISDDELKSIVLETIKEVNATSPKDMGKVIKSVLEKVQGKADGKRVSLVAQELLKKG